MDAELGRAIRVRCDCDQVVHGIDGPGSGATQPLAGHAQVLQGL